MLSAIDKGIAPSGFLLMRITSRIDRMSILLKIDEAMFRMFSGSLVAHCIPTSDFSFFIFVLCGTSVLFVVLCC